MRENIRLALPSKGRLAELAYEFLEKCGLRIHRPNERQYIASLPAHPHVQVIFQRPGDIVIGVCDGSIDFGVVGYDQTIEYTLLDEPPTCLILHEALGFGGCSLMVAAPDSETTLQTIADLTTFAQALQQQGTHLRIATKYPNLTSRFLAQHDIHDYKLVIAEGALELAPIIGYADVIVDLVSSGMTLRDNHLHILEGGTVLQSQSCLIANKTRLHDVPQVLDFAKLLLEYFEAHLRGKSSYMIVANIRGDSAESIAESLFSESCLSGLSGPTIAPVFVRNPDGSRWFSASLIVRQSELAESIATLRKIGGTGVVVTPVTYIFEEEPPRYRAMLNALQA